MQPLEPTEDALIRTLRGELAQEVAIRRLLWVMEYVTPMAGRTVHELGFYYAIDLPAMSPYLDRARDHAGVERRHALLLRWFPLDAVRDVRLLPEFLYTALGRPPATPEHIVRVAGSEPHSEV